MGQDLKNEGIQKSKKSTVPCLVTITTTEDTTELVIEDIKIAKIILLCFSEMFIFFIIIILRLVTKQIYYF